MVKISEQSNGQKCQSGQNGQKCQNGHFDRLGRCAGLDRCAAAIGRGGAVGGPRPGPFPGRRGVMRHGLLGRSRMCIIVIMIMMIIMILLLFLCFEAGFPSRGAPQVSRLDRRRLPASHPSH